MSKAINVAEAMATASDPEKIRTIEDITKEILHCKDQAGAAILQIGRCLIEAKEKLDHGDWILWLEDKVEFSERQAQRFMRLAREYPNPTPVSDLGARKALALLAVAPEDRDAFISESHVVNGEAKAVADMSARELEQAIRERDEARKAMEQAVADAKHAEESRAKMETDLRILAERQKAASDEEERLRVELEALRSKPVDVAVMSVDKEALDKARADAIAEMQAKVDKAVDARKKAEEKSKAAEAAVEAAKAEATATLRRQMEKTEAELRDARRKLDDAVKAEKQAALNSDQDLATFNVIFGEVQEQANKLHGLLLKMRGRGDGDMAKKLQQALLALSDAIRGCAE